MTPKQEAQLRQFAPDHLRVIKATMRQARKAKTETAKETPAPELVIDFSDLEARLTLSDLEDMEDASGTPGFVIFENLGSSVKGMAALIWVLHRQTDPAYTYEQAQSLPMSTLLAAMRAAAPKGKSRPLVKPASPSA